MGEEEICNTTLGLGIGVGSKMEKKVKKNKKVPWLDLSLPLHSKEEASEDEDDHEKDEGSLSSKTFDEQEEDKRRMKRSERSNEDNNTGSRKKLKLTKEQITLLENSFKLHSTLNTGQKQLLATKLDLLPRQIEVWFQNRRARTKLKQIEQECELLKKCCESLSDENRRLKKELQELRSCALKLNHQQQPPALPFYIQFPKAVICQSCEKGGSKPTHVGGGGYGEMKNAMVAAANCGGGMVQLHDNNNNSTTTATTSSLLVRKVGRRANC